MWVPGRARTHTRSAHQESRIKEGIEDGEEDSEEADGEDDEAHKDIDADYPEWPRALAFHPLAFAGVGPVTQTSEKNTEYDESQPEAEHREEHRGECDHTTIITSHLSVMPYYAAEVLEPLVGDRVVLVVGGVIPVPRA